MPGTLSLQPPAGYGSVRRDGYGTLVNTVRQNVVDETMRAQAINYAAVAVPFALFVPPAYSASVVQGELRLNSFLTSFHSSCPKTPIVLAGYSQGAHVAGDVFQDLPSAVRTSIVGVVLFGDTRFNPAQPTADEGDYSTGLRGMFAGVFGPRLYRGNQLASVHSYCTAGDPVCNFSLGNAATCGPGSLSCTHTMYATRPDSVNSYALQAATFLRQRLELFAACLDPNSVSPDLTQSAAALDPFRIEGIPARAPYLIDTTTRSLRRLRITGLDPSTISNLSWSPDGHRIAFTYVDPARLSSPATGLYVINSAGGVPRRLLSLPLDDNVATTGLLGFAQPVWSRDGRRLALPLTRDAGDSASTSVAMVPAIGGRLTEIAVPADSVAWTPDGRYLITVAFDGLRAQPVAGGASVRITTPTPSGIGAFEYAGPVYVSNAWNVFFIGGIRPGTKFDPHDLYRASLGSPDHHSLIPSDTPARVTACVPTSIHLGPITRPPAGFPTTR